MRFRDPQDVVIGEKYGLIDRKAKRIHRFARSRFSFVFVLLRFELKYHHLSCLLHSRSGYILKQSGTINQMGCCNGEVHNMTETYCSDREVQRKCSLNDVDSFKCDNLNCIDKSK